MTMPMIRIHNVETEEIIDREMTEEEYAIHVEQSETLKALTAEAEAKVAAKAALLERLGITEEEAALLV